MRGSREVAGQILVELAPFSNVTFHNCRIVWFSATLENPSTLGLLLSVFNLEI